LESTLPPTRAFGVSDRRKFPRAARAYLRPVESRFGTRAPLLEKVVEETNARSGEITRCGGAAAANQLGFTMQLLVRQVYLTSGPSRAATQDGLHTSHKTMFGSFDA